MKDYYGSIIGIIVGIILICGIAFIQDKVNSTETNYKEITMGEWISPDGVHYWYGVHCYQGFLAPRYDENGNLVIEKENR